jgi:hypothetical protein
MIDIHSSQAGNTAQAGNTVVSSPANKNLKSLMKNHGNPKVGEQMALIKKRFRAKMI